VSTITVARGRLDAAPSRIHVPLAIATVVGLFLLLGSAYTALDRPAASASLSTTGASRVARADRVATVVAGIPAELTPDTTLAVVGTVSARIALVHGDRPGDRELHVSLFEADGRPVDGATIHLAGQMRYMDHGAFEATGTSDSPGRYIVRLSFAMPGEYELRIAIATADRTGALLLDVDLPN